MNYQVKCNQIVQGNLIIFPEKTLEIPEGRIVCPNCKGHGKFQSTHHPGQITEADYFCCYDCGGKGHISKPGRPQTCPLREAGWGPWDSKAVNIDRWQFAGNDLVCTFCGSVHPEDFKEIVELCLRDENVLLELNDSGNKVYIRRPGIPNASMGAIKFKLVHLSKDDSQLLAKLNQALRVSHDRFMKKFQQHPEIGSGI